MIGKCAYGVACLLACCGLAQGQSTRRDGSVDFVMMTMAYVQQCIKADDLLRKTCARIGSSLSDKNKANCVVASVPFETRTARSYVAFKETFRTQISENDALIAKALKKTGDAFDRQFAEVRAGRISMFDLESLSRELNDRCVTVEREWLDRNRWPK